MISTEDMVRQFNYEMQKDHTDELPEERSARLAVDSAYKHLENVKTAKYANGQPKYDWSDRTAAQDDFKAKFEVWNTASNNAARTRYLNKLEAEKKAKANERAAQEAKILAENEGRLREAMRARYPGSDEDFVKEWPELKREHYRRQTLDQMSLNRPPVARF